MAIRSPLRALAITFSAVVAAVSASSCSPTSSATAAAVKCIPVTSNRVMAMAWSRDGSSLYVLHGTSAGVSWVLAAVDIASMTTMDLTGTNSALPALDVDPAGRPIWLESNDQGTRVMTLAGSSPQLQANLPHPRFIGITSTDVGLIGLESTSTDADAVPAPDALRLVRVPFDPGGSLDPLTEFGTSIVDIGISHDGSTIATATASMIDVVSDGQSLARNLDVPDGVASVDVLRAGGIGFLGTDGKYRFSPSGAEVRVVSDQWSYLSALADDGQVALAALSSESGPTGHVCFEDR